MWRKEGRTPNSSGDVFLPHTKQNSIWVSPAPCLQQVTSRCRQWAHALLLRNAHSVTCVWWPRTLWGDLQKWRQVRFLLVAYQARCEELRKWCCTLSLGGLPVVLWGTPWEWWYVHVRLVACQVYCEELCRAGDTRTSFRWSARHIVRNSVRVVIRTRPFGGLPGTLWGTLQGWWYVKFLSVTCQAHCEELRKNGDTYTSVWWPARHIVRNSAVVVTRTRTLPFDCLPGTLWENPQEWWHVQFFFATCQALC